MRISVSYAGILIFSALVPFTALPEDKPDRPPLEVPSEAKYHNGKWYFIFMNECAWNTARDRCESENGQLAVVPDSDTWEFLLKLSNGASVWLGATDEETEGVWKWVDDTPFEYNAWGKGQPDNFYNGTEDYLHTWKGEWNDGRRKGTIDGNNRVAGFICEWKG